MGLTGLTSFTQPFGAKSVPQGILIHCNFVRYLPTGASNDKSWYYVIDSTGQSGYIPRNYVLADKSGEGLEQHIDMLRDRVR